MRFRFPAKFPLKFKEMDQESKAMAGVLVAFAIVVLGAVGLSQGQAGTPSLGPPGPKPNMSAKSGGLPPEQLAEEQAEAKKKKEKAEQAKSDKALDKLADAIPNTAPRSAPKADEPAPAPPTSTPVPTAEEPAPEEPATTTPKQESKPREEPKKARKNPPKPAPSTLTAARVQAVKSGATFAQVDSQLGASLSRAELSSRYGSEPAKGMLAQEPAGRPCRYYALAPGQPAPLVRLCFDANGHLLTREFVAPQG